jgi:hypothetical protein
MTSFWNGFTLWKGFVMNGKRVAHSVGWLPMLLIAGAVAIAESKSPAEKPPRSPAQQVLAQAAEEGKFTFLVFYKTDTPAFREIARVAKEGVAKRAGKAAFALIQITNPAEKALVDQFDVSRSPMPLTLAIAPNMAVTGVFPKELKDEHLDAAIVTPTMTRCMKSLQEGKLVFVCLQTTENVAAPPVVKAMQLDPEFSARVAVVSLQVRDPAESRFLQQMQVDPRQVRAPTAALLAPPGMLIGKYDGSATRDQVAAALHKAGKCCDDPNCKHNHGTSTQAPANTRRK